MCIECEELHRFDNPKQPELVQIKINDIAVTCNCGAKSFTQTAEKPNRYGVFTCNTCWKSWQFLQL